jgi:UDP-N-acetylmuramate: L-alanyl-gamma-D-glutamyl-meso-diaminopimelate ligase
MKLGVHREQLAPSLGLADKSWFFAPKDLGWDLRGAVSSMGDRVSLARSIDELLQDLTQEARSGDHVLIMSNGGFGGLHDKLLAALRVR